MKTKSFKISLFLAILLSFSFSFSQDILDISNPNNILFSDNINFFLGEVELKSGEILSDEISLNISQNGVISTYLNNEDKYISNKNISKVTLFNDEEKLVKTIFKSINNDDKLYRVLHIKNNENGIFDLMTKPFDGKIMNDVYVLENNELVSIFNFWSSGPKKDLINYINNRDNKNYKRRDFKSLYKLFAKL